MSIDDVRIKYRNDLWFHRMVDVIYAVLAEAEMTPNEVRQAAIFACTKFEMERPDIDHMYPGLRNKELREGTNE